MLNRSRNHYRRAILLVSETRDHGSKAKLDEVVAELGTTDTVIYSVAFSPAKNDMLDSMKHAVTPTKRRSQSRNRKNLLRWKTTSRDGRSRAAAQDELASATAADRERAEGEMRHRRLLRFRVATYMNFTTQKGFERQLAAHRQPDSQLLPAEFQADGRFRTRAAFAAGERFPSIRMP